MAVKQVPHPSVDERRAKGEEARDRMPPSGHAKWEPAAGQVTPTGLSFVPALVVLAVATVKLWHERS